MQVRSKKKRKGPSRAALVALIAGGVSVTGCHHVFHHGHHDRRGYDSHRGHHRGHGHHRGVRHHHGHDDDRRR